LARSNKDINLLEALEGKKKAKISPSLLIGLLCIPLFAVIAGLVAFALITTIVDLGEERNALRDYVESPQTQAAHQEAILASQQAAQTRADADAIMAQLRHISSYPDLYVEQYNRVFVLAGSEIELSGISYDRHSGILRFNAQAGELSSLPRFVEQMRNSDIFADIQYRGYVQTKTGESISLEPMGATGGASATGGFGSSATGGAAPAGSKGNSSAGSSGSSGSSSSSAIREIIAYYYSIECLVAPPLPSLPELPEQDAATGEAATEAGDAASDGAGASEAATDTTGAQGGE
jgi:hypothetical protein